MTLPYNPGDSSKTYILDFSNQIGWLAGPALQTSRFEAACGRVRLNNNSNKMSVIVVAGAFNGAFLSSTEILDEGENSKF